MAIHKDLEYFAQKSPTLNFLSVENISKSYGERTLFSNISFGINQGQKIGFIAPNGSGKTSLLNILSGQENADTGQVIYRNELNVQFLSQNPVFEPSKSIEEVIFSADNEALKVIASYEKALLNPEDTDAYQQAFEQMDITNAWDFETQYKQVLSKLKLNDLSKKVSSLSGGQTKRLALALIILDKPEFLILDEPTNHLDLEMIEWLEAYFEREQITLFMVTHDRYFLERVCNEIIELDQGNLFSYKGNYSYFLDKRAQRIEVESTSQGKAKQLFKKELEWMRRQPKARTTKSKSRIDHFSEIKAKAHARRQAHEVQLEINMERLGNKVVELHNISKSFGDLEVLKKFSYHIQPGDRIGIIGKNGTGKSTFLNMLTGVLPPDTGKIVIGETIKFGYYTQGGIHVKEGQKVIEVIKEFGEYIPLKKGRQISAQQLLERFLFDRKKQYDYVEKLSGGERKRLYLCTVLIQNPNFLILDEPTNDLDVVTLNVLESFLMDFPGCLLVVSHDRYFMDKIVEHLFVFQGEGVIKDFPGNYSDYRAYAENAQKPTKALEDNSTLAKTTKPASPKVSYLEQKEFKKLEKEIFKLEQKKEDIQQQFLKELSPEEIEKTSIALSDLEDEIEQKTERWFELSAKIES